ncbi:MAG: HNH endonuclease signature motif containing protein [Candidatus Magnetobacterium sp. LHC-1]|nr:HNH endonuclease [Nitrospirota bacterium]
MSEKTNGTYDVIFTGKYVKGSKKDTSQISMAKILKIDVMKLTFNDDKPMLIKSNLLSFDEAVTLIDELYNVGVVCVLSIKEEATYQAIGGENKKLVGTVIEATKKALDYFLNPIKKEPDNTYHQQTEPPQDKYFQDKDYTYEEYLKSPEWRVLRGKALKRANNKCEMCGVGKTLNAHHVRYPVVYKMDHIDNIVIVCRRCHKLSHGIRD